MGFFRNKEPVPFDPSRRKLLENAGKAAAVVAVGPTAIRLAEYAVKRVGSKDGTDPEAEARARELKLQMALVEKRKILEKGNPIDRYLAFDGRETMDEESFREMVNYWAARYEIGKESGDFSEGLKGFSKHAGPIGEIFRERNVPPSLSLVALVESFFNPETWSADGPYQLTKGTADQYGVKDRTDWRQASEGAAKFFGELMKEMNGNEAFAVLKYNATFVRQYQKSLEDSGGRQEPTIGGFYAFMSERASDVRRESFRNNRTRAEAERSYARDIDGIRTNAQYLAKYVGA